MFTEPGQPVLWRGPRLHRAIEQFLSDVYWGDLDVLLLDLPPGTGDIALSVAQMLPSSELIIVTTPQAAAAEVAERAGTISAYTHQGVVGVIENMSWLTLPDGSRLAVFGEGGGARLAASLSDGLVADVPLLGQIPLDPAVREGGDDGTPVVLTHPDSPGALVLRDIARLLGARKRGLVGKPLGVTPV
jgi:ATP-binding protein involved in chromosome partitioning